MKYFQVLWNITKTDGTIDDLVIESFFEYSFLYFGRKKYHWKNMEDFAQQITCNFNKSDKNENTTCIFSKLFILDEDKHGVNFIGTMLQFLLNSDNFLEQILLHRNKSGGLKLSPKEKNTILDYWKEEKWEKLKILWKILLENHSEDCLSSIFQNLNFRMFQIPSKDSKELEFLIFKYGFVQENISKKIFCMKLYETLIKAFLENSIIQLSFRISEQNVAVYKNMKTGVKMCKLPKYSPKNLICFPNEKTNFFSFGNPHSIFMKVLYHA